MPRHYPKKRLQKRPYDSVCGMAWVVLAVVVVLVALATPTDALCNYCAYVPLCERCKFDFWQINEFIIPHILLQRLPVLPRSHMWVLPVLQSVQVCV